jgi:single-stranded DNA-binding protein
MSDKGQFIATVGKVGTDPELKETKVGPVLTFRFAVQTGYPSAKGEKGPDPVWYDVTTFKQELFDQIKGAAYKGANVCVEGYIKGREYNGKTYYSITASRVGKVEWLKKTELPF